MKTYRLKDLSDVQSGHILNGIIPGDYLYHGGLSIMKPGERSHTNDGPGGIDYHVHQDCEAFIVIQGKGTIEIDKVHHPVVTGDIVVVEPGEDHHVLSSENDPLIVLWYHAGAERHKNQLL